MNIYIPTLDRVGRQITLERLPPMLRKRAILVCPRAEVGKHPTSNILPFDKKGAAPKRDFIIEHAISTGAKKLVMLDDDVVLQRRREGNRITNATEQEYFAAFKWLEKTLDSVAHCGWGSRFLGWNTPGEYSEPGRMMCCLAYHIPKLVGTGARFTKGVDNLFPIDDMNMTLQLLTAGYANRVSLEWRASPAPSNAPGGFSSIRTAKRQSDAARRLATLFPDFVKLRTKKAWAGMEAEEMVDVTVYWKKALKSALEAA